MGGDSYWYFVAYEKNAQDALDKLREREFRAGRYRPAMDEIAFREPALFAQAPGPQHDSPEDAYEDAAPSGTASILDLEWACSGKPEDNCATLIEPAVVEELYGTPTPCRAQVEADLRVLGRLERGQGCYFPIYSDGVPTELFFGGVSFD